MITATTSTLKFMNRREQSKSKSLLLATRANIYAWSTRYSTAM